LHTFADRCGLYYSIS
jgi:hypothetical protein